jgi:HD-like signal output (HDOD) protein
VGFRLAERWSFPDSLAEAIRCHHEPEQGSRHRELDGLIFLANLIMSRFHAGLEIERQGTHSLAPRLAAIGLSASQLPQIVDMIPMDVFEASPVAAISG